MALLDLVRNTVGPDFNCEFCPWGACKKNAEQVSFPCVDDNIHAVAYAVQKPLERKESTIKQEVTGARALDVKALGDNYTCLLGDWTFDIMKGQVKSPLPNYYS